MLIANSIGHYRFLKGIDPYSCGVVADPGWEMVHVTLPRLTLWTQGFRVIEDYLRAAQVPRTALCAMELRSPKPFSMDGFIRFNREYRTLLEQWQLLVDGINPIARTNVAPLADAPRDVCVHAFSFVRPHAQNPSPTFVVAGAGELRDGILEEHRIIRRGETSASALLDKAEYVLQVMTERLQGLGVGWQHVTQTNVYTAHPIDDSLRSLLLERMGPASRYGLTWHITRPPVLDIEFEMDVRGARTSLQL